jgi:hypothetical protein
MNEEALYQVLCSINRKLTGGGGLSASGGTGQAGNAVQSSLKSVTEPGRFVNENNLRTELWVFNADPDQFLFLALDSKKETGGSFSVKLYPNAMIIFNNQENPSFYRGPIYGWWEEGSGAAQITEFSRRS